MALFSAFYNIRFFGKGKVPWPKPHVEVEVGTDNRNTVGDLC